MIFENIIIDSPKELVNYYKVFVEYWKHNFDNIENLGRFLYIKCSKNIKKEFYQIKSFNSFKCLKEKRQIFFSKELPELYKSLVKKYILLSKQPFEIYRYIGIENLNDFLTSFNESFFIKHYRLGIHWTLNFDFAYNYGLEKQYGKISLIIKALVKREDINWIQTMIQNTLLWFGQEEDEITLKKKSKIHVISIIEFGEEKINREININKLIKA